MKRRFDPLNQITVRHLLTFVFCSEESNSSQLTSNHILCEALDVKRIFHRQTDKQGFKIHGRRHFENKTDRCKNITLPQTLFADGKKICSTSICVFDPPNQTPV